MSSIRDGGVAGEMEGENRKAIQDDEGLSQGHRDDEQRLEVTSLRKRLERRRWEWSYLDIVGSGKAGPRAYRLRDGEVDEMGKSPISRWIVLKSLSEEASWARGVDESREAEPCKPGDDRSGAGRCSPRAEADFCERRHG
jgi:hypothetical protein